MYTPRLMRSPKRPRRRSTDGTSIGLALSLGVAVLGLGGGALGTLAAWTDTAGVSGSAIGAARVDLQVQGLDSVTAFNSINSSTMAPGNSTAGVLTVKNNGTVPLSYYVDAAATNADGKGLAAALVVKVTSNSTTSGSAPSKTCAGTALAGTATSFGPSFVGSSTSLRTLVAGATENLCIQATLPPGASASLQGASTNISFNFPAETSPTATAWNDSVPVSGSTLGAATPATPVLNCAAQIPQQSVVNWAAPAGATSYLMHYGAGSASLDEVTTTSYPFKAPASGVAYIQAVYGVAGEWVSANSNSRTYFSDGTNSTCS
jgi:predicted ribosomally synthesized peptide with SipW-like signal peptide